MKKFKQEDYERIIKTYVNKYKKSAKQTLDREFVYKADIYNMSRSELTDFILDKICINPKSIKYMRNQRDFVNSFLDWSAEQGYIKNNPMRSEDSYYDNFFTEKALKHINVTVFYNDTVEETINKLNLNKDLYELLIRGFYEGIPSVSGFISLKWADVDYDNYTIKIDDEVRSMSESFFNVLRRYSELESFEYYKNNKPHSYKLSNYEDYVLKYNSRAKVDTIELYYRYFVIIFTRYFAEISGCVDKEITSDMLYISGFINFVKEECNKKDKPNEYFINLFYVRNNKRGFTAIKDYALEYGFCSSGALISEIRSRCLPYIANSQYNKII